MSDTRRATVHIDVTAAVATGESLSVGATVVAPANDGDPARPVDVLFGYPGGGYTRHYFDLPLSDASGPYNQAEFHAARGAIFVACDHLGVGDSDVPATAVDLDAVARANAAAAAEVLHRLASGTLVDDLAPVAVRSATAMGQSYGGFLLTLAQAAQPVFDGVGFLGWSGVETVAAWPKDTDMVALISKGTRGDDPDNPRGRIYHWPDVPREIVHADLTRPPFRAGSSEIWGAEFHPGGPAVVRNRNPLERGAVEVEARSLTVPVFVASGEVDVIPDLWTEATAYRSSRDVTLCRFPRMAHMHNFASTRVQLWTRLDHWRQQVGESLRDGADLIGGRLLLK